MSAPNINQILKVVANQFSSIIHRKILNTGPWINLDVRDTWPDEMGDVISELTYQRSLPDTKLVWSDYRSAATSGMTGTTCNVPAQTINFNYISRQFGLQRAAVQSPRFCVDDLRFAFKRQNQLEAIQNILAENTKFAWDERTRDEYVRVCQNKIIATNSGGTLPGWGEIADVPDLAVDASGNDLLGAAFPTADATSILTKGILDKVRMRLIREGGGLSASSVESGSPVFTLVCSGETSEGVFKFNPDLRMDLRYAKPSELLAPLGVERSYGGFFHVIDDFMPRFTRDGTSGQYTMIRPWAKDGDGNWNINPAYEGAPYELSVVYHKQVRTTLIPKPISNPGGGQKFDPVSYTGQFRFVNIPSEELNVDGNNGFFRGILASGTKVVRPEFGYAIIHLRASLVDFISGTDSVSYALVS